MSVHSGACDVDMTTAVGWLRLIELMFPWSSTGTLQGGATRLFAPFRFTMA
jgi:hypothetical protein